MSPPREVSVNGICRTGGWAALVLFNSICLTGLSVDPADGQQISNDAFLTNVNIEVAPIAFLDFIDDPLLYLEVPPPDSTAPVSGVRFLVTGNAAATLVAEPDEFLDVPGQGWLGKAVNGSEAIGFALDLRFPRTGVPGSSVQTAALPGGTTGHTEPPLTVDLTLTGGAREGVIHMETSQNYTDHGGLALPGLYEGNVVLTLTVDNL